ncbi:hypothetical protein F1188_00245 [Roseospira marina]|uniref:Uncharacterized protein n=1 Tax=Roseospira marina TaxID=140057 RepID=A0A5M6IH51_9PROT|nr:hypothetical protein [Roseospira marina]KAA5607237.1 hypothetical protein F1188_00245 [Roseospira marina]MBB4312611.1 hypothetical protein [Roseospira marina]MBB5085373.1 hypothetical protein [Roseospira marina]
MRHVFLHSKGLIGTLLVLVLAAGPIGASLSRAADTAANRPNGAVHHATADGAAFVRGTEDVPLMAGLREVPERGVVFESPGGRIVEAWAVGYLPPDTVRQFYRDSLPQLGWQVSGDLIFRREGEVLTLDFPAGPDSPLTVRFRIAPGR